MPRPLTAQRADWNAAKAEIREILVQLAKDKETITYAGLCARLTTIHVHYHSHFFHRLLIAACEDADLAGEGRLCALVVTKQSGLPGGGFFRYAADSGDDVSDPLSYWRQVADELFMQWDGK